VSRTSRSLLQYGITFGFGGDTGRRGVRRSACARAMYMTRMTRMTDRTFRVRTDGLAMYGGGLFRRRCLFGLVDCVACRVNILYS